MDLKRTFRNGFLSLLALICAGVLPAYANGVNLLINGSFEDPVISGTPACVIFSPCIGFHNGVSGNDNIGGWLLFGKDGVDAGMNPISGAPATILLLNSNYTEPTNGEQTLHFTPQNGAQALDLTGEGNQGIDQGVKQTVSTSPGTTYLLTFWFGHQYSSADGYTGPAALMLFVNGASVGSFGNSLNTVNDVTWTQFSYQFTATDQTTIAFGNNTPVGNNFDGLDNVSLVAVPEAASLVLLGIGTAALMLLRRRAEKPQA